jgi:putative ABC transport system ATP-binding protein
MTLVALEQITKIYTTREATVTALEEIDFTVDQGEFVLLQGPSGSGKTTLLMITGAMLSPTRGRVTIDGQNLFQMSSRDKEEFRARTIGFVFQMFHLIPYLKVIDNVVLAAGAVDQADVAKRAENLLGSLGMGERILHRPSELSVGEKQRVAIARALINQPKIVLADEPTGNLDPENADAVLSRLSDFHREGGTVVVATHNVEAEQFADRVIRLDRGRIASA